MLNTTLIIIIAVVAFLIFLFILMFAKQYRKVGPNEVLIISGGRKRKVTDPDGTVRKIGYRTHIGGGTLVKPFLESYQVLPLDIFTLTLKTPEVMTAQGVFIVAEATAQVKIKGDDYSIRMAAEQFLGKGAAGIESVAYTIVEGCMRAILGKMSVEEIYRRREEFASQVKEAAIDDFARMGLTLLAFSLADLSDSQGYLSALGKPRIAQVKRDALIAQAEADKDAAIKSAIARKDGDVAKLAAETEISRANRDYEMKRAEYLASINQKKAHADLSYDLEKQRMLQQIKKEEGQVRVIEKDQNIQLETLEIARKEKELEAAVKKSADAKKYQIITEANAEAYRLEAEAKGKANADRLLAQAEAERIRITGEAEAETMRQKATAYADFNMAAIYQMLVDKMPELARAVSEPLGKVDKILLVGGETGVSKITGQVAEILAQLPLVVKHLTGLDLEELLHKLTSTEKQTVKPDANQQNN